MPKASSFELGKTTQAAGTWKTKGKAKGKHTEICEEDECTTWPFKFCQILCLFSKFYLQILALISSFQDYFLNLDSPIWFPLFFDCFLYDAFLYFGIILSRFHFASYTPSFAFCIL